MAQMTAVKEAVKDSLLGTTEDNESSQMSAQTRARFLGSAIKDPATGELYMGPDEFINAVAPKSEDFVSFNKPIRGDVARIRTVADSMMP